MAQTVINSNYRIRGKSHPETARRWHYKTNYGISLEEFNKLVIEQDSKCKICQRFKSASGRYGLHVDHDHYTGKIRGLLCHKCNAAIGMLREDITIVERTLKYMRGEL